jgi:hypothetical protein
VLHAHRPRLWSSRYEVVVDGTACGTWVWRAFARTAELDLAGYRYAVEASGVLRTRYRLVDGWGKELARTESPGRATWVLHADGRPHTFRRPSVWKRDHEMVAGEQVIGHVRLTGGLRGEVEADLPWLSLPAQVFTVVVLLAVWAAEDSTSTST